MSDQTRTTDRRTSYGSVLADREYRVILAAGGLSWIGDYLARAAITLLVFQKTGSVADSALTFAISYLPWIAGGPVLAALAERYPYRRVMVFCDIARAGLVACVIIKGLPVWGIWLLLFLAALLNSPFEASRSALVTRIFTDDRYVLATSLQQTMHQAAILLGYGPGPALATHFPRGVLLADAATFLASAALISAGVRAHGHPPPTRPRDRLLIETMDGFRYIARSPVLRAVGLVVILLVTVTTVPEGLAAAWAGRLPHPIGGKGISQALIMGASPVGQVIGGFLINRLIAAEHRARLLPALAVLAPVALVPALLHPNALVIAGCAMVSGAALAGVVPNAIGIFAKVVSPQFRTRAFGVMQTGVQLSQAVGVLIAGALADRFDLPTVVGLWSATGAVAVLFACVIGWPGPRAVEDAAAAGDPPARVPQQDRGHEGVGQHRADLSGATTID